MPSEAHNCSQSERPAKRGWQPRRRPGDGISLGGTRWEAHAGRRMLGGACWEALAGSCQQRWARPSEEHVKSVVVGPSTVSPQWSGALAARARQIGLPGGPASQCSTSSVRQRTGATHEHTRSIIDIVSVFLRARARPPRADLGVSSYGVHEDAPTAVTRVRSWLSFLHANDRNKRLQLRAATSERECNVLAAFYFRFKARKQMPNQIHDSRVKRRTDYRSR